MIKQRTIWLTLLLLTLPITSSYSDEATNLDSVVALLELILNVDEDSARKSLDVIAKQTQSGELDADQVAALQQRLDGLLAPIIADATSGLRYEAAVVRVAESRF